MQKVSTKEHKGAQGGHRGAESKELTAVHGRSRLEPVMDRQPPA